MKRLFIIIIIALSVNTLAQNVPVSNVQMEALNSNTALFTWDAPADYDPSEVTISWSKGEMYDQVGAGTWINWPVAHRFDINDIRPYVGWKLKSISFVPCQRRVYYSLRAWTGDNDNLQRVLDQDVGTDTILNVYNTYEVLTDVFIEEGKEFWVGYNAIDSTGGWPYALDAGPAYLGKGDLLSYGDEYHPFMPLGFNKNFCIRAVIESPEGKIITLSAANQDVKGDSLTGYNVYKDTILISRIVNPTQKFHIVNNFNEWDDVNFCVTAVYGDDESEEACYSHPAPALDYWTDIVTYKPDGYIEDADNVTITSADGLAWLISVVNGLNGQVANDMTGKTVTLANDVDVSNGMWIPIGTPENNFKGVFYGNYKKIIGLTIDDVIDKYCGLFGYVYEGQVRNVILADGSINANSYIGSIAGVSDNLSIIDGCQSNIKIKGNDLIGGIVGYNRNSTIRNCSYTADSLLVSGIYTTCGGIAARSESKNNLANALIENCFCITNFVTKIHAELGGGILGHSINESYSSDKKAIIRNCYAVSYGNINLNNFGGVIGKNGSKGMVSNCYCFSPSYLNIANANEGDIRNSSRFDGSGTEWILEDSVKVSNVYCYNLYEALSHWVSAMNGNNEYFEWFVDNDMTNNGFPRFDLSYESVDESAISEDNITVYPNPARDMITIYGAEMSDIQIYNAVGCLVGRCEDSNEMNVSNFSSGIYFLKMRNSEGKIICRKIVIDNVR